MWDISFIPHSFEMKPFDFCCSFYKEHTVFSFVKFYECLNVCVGSLTFRKHKESKCVTWVFYLYTLHNFSLFFFKLY